ncbi:hypothetical protein WJX77_001560 [Trebouxia sp. C0004]
MSAKKSNNTSGHGRSKFSSSPMYKFWDDLLYSNPRVTGHGVVDSGNMTGSNAQQSDDVEEPAVPDPDGDVMLMPM